MGVTGHEVYYILGRDGRGSIGIVCRRCERVAWDRDDWADCAEADADITRQLEERCPGAPDAREGAAVMTTMPDKCPLCGAAAMGVRVLQHGLDRPRLMDVGDYECETLIVSQEGRHVVVVDGETCLRRQNARIAEHYESVIGFYADLIKDRRICQERVERREQQVTLEVYDDDDGDDD